MPDDIISVKQPNFKEVAENLQQNKAKASEVIAMTHTPGWKYVKEEAKQIIEQVKDVAIKGTFKDWETYRDRTEEARALQRLIDIIDSFERKYKSANRNLKKI